MDFYSENTAAAAEQAPPPNIATTSTSTRATPSPRAESAMAPASRAGAQFRTFVAFLLILIIGLGARASVSFTTGYGADLGWFYRWTKSVTDSGFDGLYRETDCNYPPFYLLVFNALGATWKALADPALADSDAFRAWLRVPAALADVGIALLLLLEGRRIFGAAAGLVAAAIYFLNPAAIYATAYWGQVDSVHSAMLLAALVATNRKRHVAAGFFTALSLLQKLQSVAVVPLFIFECYRYARWGGLARFVLGIVIAAVAILSPFAWTGVLSTAIKRGYSDVVGQYPESSINAYNLWYLLGLEQTIDATPPRWLVEYAAAGESSVGEDAAWYLPQLRKLDPSAAGKQIIGATDYRYQGGVSWRKLAIVGFSLAVAAILSLVGLTRRHDLRALAAGALAMAAFVLLTEMHERYAYPALALLPLWAAGGGAGQAVYWLFSSLLLLNLADVLGPDQLQRHVGGAMVLVFGAMSVGLVIGRKPQPRGEAHSDVSIDVEHRVPILVRAFQWLTVCVIVAAAAGAGWFAKLYYDRPRIPTSEVLYLSNLKPVASSNGWQEVGIDKAVSGAPLRAGNRYFVRGIGVHAPARLEYEVPRGFDRFEAKLALNPPYSQTVRCAVMLDGERVWTSGRITRGAVVDVIVPLKGARELVLEVDPAGGMKGDHVDWCDARFVPVPAGSSEPAASEPTAVESP